MGQAESTFALAVPVPVLLENTTLLLSASRNSLGMG
jgi:hypothetical protein